MNPVIQVNNLSKSFNKKQVLFDLGLSVQAGEMVALIGASGSGKSTLLRHLAGLACADTERPGTVRMLGRPMQSNGRSPAQQEEFVVMHSDSVEASGFVSHLKLPHYVDFQSELDLIRTLQRAATCQVDDLQEIQA